jgi:4-carboxymuconolactone decarboxylase
MARLAYVAPPGAVTDRIRERRGGKLVALDGVLLHSPELADGWNSMLGAVRGKSTLPPDIRELAILVVAARNGADYEWVAHEPIARSAGVSDEQLAVIRWGGAPASDTAGFTPGFGPAFGPAFSPAQAAAVAYATASTVDVTVPAAVFSALREHFSDREILEITVTVAAYNMVSRVLVALEVQPGDDPFAAG